jgi:hypothetical protein
MISRTKPIGLGALLIIIFASIFASLLVSQSNPSQPAPRPTQAVRSAAGLEFPVILRQKVMAGKTPVGTKVQAKLTLATFLNGVVVSEGSIFSGEVTESAAKSATDPSRLAIRMDSVKWKNKAGSTQNPAMMELAPKVYLTAWYYPLASPINKDSLANQSHTIDDPRRGDDTGMHSGHRNPTSLPFPASDSDPPKPPAPSSEVSNHRALMKDVETTHDAQGAVVLESKRSSIKLDKATTYVLASGDLH